MPSALHIITYLKNMYPLLPIYFPNSSSAMAVGLSFPLLLCQHSISNFQISVSIPTLSCPQGPTKTFLSSLNVLTAHLLTAFISSATFHENEWWCGDTDTVFLTSTSEKCESSVSGSDRFMLLKKRPAYMSVLWKYFVGGCEEKKIPASQDIQSHPFNPWPVT
jgi:hypothetical protein